MSQANSKIKIKEVTQNEDTEILQQKYVLCFRNVLGSGSFATVYGGYMFEDENEKIAIKVIKKNIFEKNKKNYDNIVNNVKREYENQRKLTSQNVVKMIDAIEDEKDWFLILEFCEEKSLSEKLKQGPLQENEALWIFKQIVNGYKELSEQNIMHRDLKPENILFSKGIAKIADFGFSKFIGDQNQSVIHTKLGTPLYLAPEISTGQYTATADIWSLGVIFYKMLYGQVPFDLSIPSQFENQKKQPIQYPETIKPDLITLLQKMLVVDPKKRISWQELYAENLLELIKPPQSEIFESINQSKAIRTVKSLESENKITGLYNYFIYIWDILDFIRSLIKEVLELHKVVQFSVEQTLHYNIITTKYLINEIKFYQRVLNGEPSVFMQILILPNDFQLFKKSDYYYQVLNNLKDNLEALEQYYAQLKEKHDKHFKQIQRKNTNKETIQQFEYYSVGLQQNENNPKFQETFNKIYLDIIDHIIDKMNNKAVQVQERDNLFRTLIKLLHCFQPLNFRHHKVEAFKVEQKLQSSSSLEKEFNDLYCQVISS